MTSTQPLNQGNSGHVTSALPRPAAVCVRQSLYPTENPSPTLWCLGDVAILQMQT